MTRRMTRRTCLKSSAAAGAALAAPYVVSSAALGLAGTVAPSNRIAAAQIGVGMMGTGDLRNFMKHFPEIRIVAVCDVDKERRNVNNVIYGREPARKLVERHYAAKTRSGAYKGCRAYTDYRQLLAKERDLDAVMVATPDHSHAAVSIAAMKAGKHVYCQKPLTYSAQEAVTMAEVAGKMKVATQCGTGNYTQEGVFRMREMIAAGAIGAVREVHNWSNRPVWPQGMARPKDTPPVPPGLDWDLWLAPAPKRPYHPSYLPFVWRGWLDFGTGALGDMGCYSFDVIVRALKLTHPTVAEACCSRLHGRRNTDSYPRASIVRYRFPARGSQPAVKLTWYDGGLSPARPAELEAGQRFGDRNGGLIFVGDKGKLLCDFTGAAARLIPESRMKSYKPPPRTLVRSIGHKQEWVRACKGGEQAGANFRVAGFVSEILALGNAAVRQSRLP